MTEAEWFACVDPEPMLQFLRGKVSDRKLRLFACGCCRRIWDLLTTPAAREAVLAAEGFADGLATAAEREAAWRGCRDTVVGPAGDFLAADGSLRWSIADAACWAASPLNRDGTPLPGTEVGVGVFRSAAEAKSFAAWDTYVKDWHAKGGSRKAAVDANERDAALERFALGLKEASVARKAETSAQADLLRDIVDNPFRPASIDPSWLTWNDHAVAKLARTIYDDRSFERMPFLADALQQAGCTNAALLAHCQDPGQHARGCWLLDLLLGKA